MRYLIIGNSAAGINAASAIRLMDPLGDITIITKEKFYSYGRPLISYYLSNKIQPENMYYHNQIFYTQQHLNVMLNTEVQAININRKELLIKTINNTKNVILYDKLLIASGSSPIKPSILGLDYNCNNVCTFLSYQDSIKLKSMITNSSKVVILGAGLIGLKVAEGLCGQVDSINVIDLSDRIMSSTLDISSAYIVQKHMESYNINFKLKTSVIEVLKDNNDKIYKVVLSNGETLDCNILIIAIGVTPNVHLAKQAGLNVDRGIVVNEFLQTSNDCVYAAGDCIESYDFFSNTKTIFALWTSASNQGEIAGLNMAINNNNNYNSSRLLCYDFSMNAISFFGMKLISAGMICSKLKYNNVQNINIESERNKLFKLSICNNNLVGFTMINSIRRAGIYTDLIKNKIPLSTLLYDITTKDIGLNVYPKIERMKLLYYNHH